ncbi:hypothetical protein CK203_106770 [Vitis vinifera]|uniref:Uncharacterized protein n=1 Tax=Vitis vinifera TaxID=29760 RepID=A0A438BVE2_VITVI|nr:hypothetical protein CK203_106770 [Vitis vinifera]
MATSSSDSFPIAINATQQITARLTPTNFPSWHAQFESLLLAITSLAMSMALIPAHPYRRQLMQLPLQLITFGSIRTNLF